MGKLAALTQNINDWEDDTKHSSNLIVSVFYWKFSNCHALKKVNF